MTMRLAFLLSGRGSTLQNILNEISANDWDIEVVKVISSRSKAGGLQIAKAAAIPTGVVRKMDFPDDDSFSRAITQELDTAKPDYIVFGGFMCFYKLPEHYHNRIINIHPALIPAFSGKGMYGDRVHKAVLDYGVKITGCTVHFVDEKYDTGPIIAQEIVPVLRDDTVSTLAQRVLTQERKLLPKVVYWLSKGLISVDGRRVNIIEEDHSNNLKVEH